jgi:hypothetical protein
LLQNIYPIIITNMNIICKIKTIWRTLGRPAFFLDYILIDGCDYIEQENGDLICEVCGRNG